MSTGGLKVWNRGKPLKSVSSFHADWTKKNTATSCDGNRLRLNQQCLDLLRRQDLAR